MSQELDFDAIFNAYMLKNKKAWAHDRSSTLGASEAFDCLRKQWFNKRGKKFGFEPDDDYVEDWGAMERGNLIEQYFVVPGMYAGLPKQYELLFAGTDQQTLVLGKNSATPDGLITGLKPGPLKIKCGGKTITLDLKTDCVTFEIKSIFSNETMTEEKARHSGQTHMQIGLIRDKTKHRPTHAIILYVDASFLSRLKAYVVEYDPEIYSAGKQRAEMLWKIDDPMRIVPEGKFDNSCKYCPFTQACGASTRDAIKSFKENVGDDMDVAQMHALVKDYLEADAAYEEMKGRLVDAKEAIKDLLTERKLSRLSCDAWRVNWSSQAGNITIDKEAMEADGIDLSKYEKKGAPFDKLTIIMK